MTYFWLFKCETSRRPSVWISPKSPATPSEMATLPINPTHERVLTFDSAKTYLIATSRVPRF
jgi:hypothetical protein